MAEERQVEVRLDLVLKQVTEQRDNALTNSAHLGAYVEQLQEEIDELSERLMLKDQEIERLNRLRSGQPALEDDGQER